MERSWKHIFTFVIICFIFVLSSTQAFAPKFVNKPSNVTVKIGKNAQFKCKATGLPVPTITWYKKGTAVSSFMLRHHVGTFFKTLYIRPAYWSDTGQITCEASNIYGTIRAHAYLRVVTKTKPTWHREPNNVTLYVGQNINIPCSANGVPDPWYMWTKNMIPVKYDPHISTSPRGDMVFAPVSMNHAGKYICKAFNTAGSISKSIYIKIVKDPSIISNPKDTIGVVGQEIFLQCIVIGSSPTIVTWKKDGKTITTDSRIVHKVKLNDGDGMTTRVHTLTIKPAISSDAGLHKCVARNQHGIKTSKGANVTFAGFSIAPSVLLPKQRVKATVNTDVTLKCTFTGIPLPQITWLRDFGHAVVTLKRTTGTPLTSDMVETTYTVKHVSTTDEGSFLCMGHNNAGVATGNITLEVQADPRKPEGIPFKSKVTAKKGTNATLECRFTAHPQPEITWSRSGHELQYTLGQKIVNDTYRATYTVVNVDYNDTDEYVCLGQNPHGTAKMMVNLVVQGIPLPPTDFYYVKVSNEEIQFSWIPGSSGGSEETFIIEYKRSEDLSWTRVEVGSNNSKILHNPNGWNSVSVRVKARNAHGTSEPSKELYITIVVAKKPPKPERSTGNEAIIVGGAVGALLFVAVLVLLIIVLWRKRKRMTKQDRDLRPQPSVVYRPANNEQRESQQEPLLYDGVYETPRTVIADPTRARQPIAEENDYETIGKPSSWEVPKRCLTITEKLGSGHFGQVVKASMKTQTGTKEVAVKMLKESAGEHHKKEFLAELDLMKSLGTHSNIVGLVGCCTKGDYPYIIVEYCSLGNLRDFLRKSKGNREYSNLASGSISLTSSDLLSFMWQVARGMSFLASKKLVHRDLAARNVLVHEDKTCKIADFGLARDIYQENQYLKTTEGELPLRWMALESIFHGITTIESDVWSFGVLIWEIITLGANPYPGFTREQLISNLHLGYRMPRPPYCDEKLYNVIWQCWHVEPSERPTFTMLCRTLHRMRAAEKILIDLANFDAEYINAKKDGEPVSP